MKGRIIDPEVCGGRPIVVGTRMRVGDVLDALASGVTLDQLLANVPYPAREDVAACLAYGARGRPRGGASPLMRLLVDAQLLPPLDCERAPELADRRGSRDDWFAPAPAA